MLSTANMRLIFGQIKTNSKHEGVTVRVVKGGWLDGKNQKCAVQCVLFWEVIRGELKKDNLKVKKL